MREVKTYEQLVKSTRSVDRVKEVTALPVDAIKPLTEAEDLRIQRLERQVDGMGRELRETKRQVSSQRAPTAHRQNYNKSAGGNTSTSRLQVCFECQQPVHYRRECPRLKGSGRPASQQYRRNVPASTGGNKPAEN